jgi:AraC-like DNA-binding protein
VKTKKKQRIQNINQMLLEMASGNFFFRLERSSKNDNLEAISISLNMLAEEIQETMLHQGYANSNITILQNIQMSLILDDSGVIQMVNQNTCNILSVLQTDIIGKPFTDFLIEASHTKWHNLWKASYQKQWFDTSLELTFKSKDNLVIPQICYITMFKDKSNAKKKTLITVIHQTNSQDVIDNDLKQRVIQFSNQQKDETDKTSEDSIKPKLRLSFEDIRKLRKGHDIIINNLDKQLPSLKDFALQLGTNEFKLKYGFKELYGTTVYRFLKQERLRKAQMMIQHSDVSIKSIAYMVGFKSMPHFSRSFKERYGFSPSALRKNSILNNNDIS